MRPALGHVVEQADLQRPVGREASVPALRWMGAVAVAVPGEVGFAQPGAGRNDGDGAFRLSLPGVQRDLRLGRGAQHAVGHGLQVVEQPDGLQPKRLAQGLSLHDPGEVGDARPPVAHRPGHIETGRRDRVGGLGAELAHDGFERVVVAAEKARGGQRFTRPALQRVDAYLSLRAPNIAC